MTDITHLLPPGWDAPKHVEPVEIQVMDAMKAAGLEPPSEIKIDGQLHRFSTKGRKKDDSGWYVIYPDEPQAGRFGCWRDQIDCTFRADISRELSAAENITIMRRQSEAKAERDRERERKAEVAADTVTQIWGDRGGADPEHPYLKRKGIQPHGARVTGDGRLVVPLYDAAGNLSTLQYISDDGDKRYHLGGSTRGCFWVLGDIGKTIYIVEGFATGATILEATSNAVVIAYSAGNIVPTTATIRNKYPSASIVIVADNDESGVGKNYADQAAAKYGARVIVPPIQGDANDYVKAGYNIHELLNPPQSDWLTKAKDFSSEPAPIAWLIKHWLQDKALIMVHGPSGGGKTFLVLDWCLRISSKTNEWLTHKVHNGTVVYLAGEGHHGLKSRVAAWRQHYNIDDPDMYLSSSGCDLNTPEGYMRVVEALNGLDVPPRLIVVDTLHRFLSGDENSAQDAKTMLDACNALMTEYACSVLLVHHTGVSEEAQHRARGSSAWKGALENEISVTPPKREGESIQIIQRKAKDSEVAEPVFIDLQSVQIKGWLDEDGDPVSSCVIVEGVEPIKVTKDPLQKLKQTFEEAWRSSGEERLGRNPYVTRSALETMLEGRGLSAGTIRQYLKPTHEKGIIGPLLDAKAIEEASNGWIIICNDWLLGFVQ
jgi:putative DNA primase/helicase